MPSKGSRLKCGKRYNPINRELYKSFKEATGTEIDFDTFKQIIWDTNAEIADAIANDESGVKMFENLGHVVVTKYKSSKVPIDWVSSNKLGRRIPLLNLHSFGYIHHIKWFKMGVKTRNAYVFKFEGARKLTRSVAKLIQTGKRYFKWENTDFWSSTKMERTFNKFYKKEH